MQIKAMILKRLESSFILEGFMPIFHGRKMLKPVIDTWTG